MDGFVAWLKQLQFDGVWQTAVLVAASLLCITFHETCHGLVAYWLGDPTAKRAGRLTLNPLRHVDIGGLLMMALFRFGWAKPVPVCEPTLPFVITPTAAKRSLHRSSTQRMVSLSVMCRCCSA